MKYFKKLLTLFVVFSLIISFSAFKACAFLFNNDKSDYVFLITGIDDEAGNSDAIILASIDKSVGTLDVLRIPRDTSVCFRGHRARINSVFATRRAEGADDTESLISLKAFLEDALGIYIDASFALTTETFVRLVDAVGGVDIMLDAPLVIKSANYILDLQKGSNLLSGMDALLFVRHRSSYPNADIGRINAQEVFVSALLEKINSFDLCHYYKIFDVLSETLITDNARVATASLISLAFNARDYKMTHYILPGVSEVIDGVWYYRINISEARVILEKLFNNSLLNKALLG